MNISHLPQACDVKTIRKELNLTQQEMADMLCISIRTLQNWEQGRSELDPSARTLLAVFRHSPQTVVDAVCKCAKPG